MLSTCDSLQGIYNRTEVENDIHRDFWVAFMAWEEAPEEEKSQASLRLNNTVRQLYDFMIRGELPQRMRAASI